MHKYKYLSLFSGIGGFEQGIGKDGLCIGYSEIDKYACQIYQRHFPTHRNYGDITALKAGDVPEFDLLVAGFPCQAFSIAGKRCGFEDTRGTMFFEIARIVREKQPRLLLLENVKGLLSHNKGTTFLTVITALDELGYDLQWQVLNSKNHGVPQNRERVFIIGHLGGTPRPKVFPFRHGGQATGVLTGHQTNTLTARYNAAKPTGSGMVEGRFNSPNLGQRIWQINQPKHSSDRVYHSGGICPTLTTMQGGNSQPFVRIEEGTKKGYAEALKGDTINLSYPNSGARRGRVGKGVAHTLDTGMRQYTLQGARIRRLTPTECERLQGFPVGWTQDVSDTQRYKTLGNAVTVNVVRDICARLLAK